MAIKALVPVAAGLLFLTGCSTIKSEPLAVKGIVERLAPDYADDIEFEQIESPSGKDVFELEATPDGKIVIRGNNPIAMAVGLNHYLKYHCNSTVSWFADQPVELPETLPTVPQKVRKEARVETRFFLNYCTFGYTMPWWQWRDWERLIDWMALNGINMPLAITGQEAIWQKVWTKEFGLTDEEVRSFFTGPAHLPWHRMSNIDRWQGPLPQSWLDHQLALQKRILARERELGMTPVLPAFNGHVPEILKEKYPEAKIEKLKPWA
ncbi:MAG: alpha-N-acetylglucosaminidase TIM-barrel domain-containing protein, partial [Verrucomicrobiota bacterium]